MVRSPTAGRARLSSRSPVGRTAAAERCPAHARRSRSTRPDPLDITGNPPRGCRLAPLRARPRRPCFPPPPTRAGTGSRTSSGQVGPQSLSLSGGAHLMHQLLPWGKLVWLFSNSCLHRMHVFVAPSMGCVSSVVVVCIPLHPSDSEKRVRVETRIFVENLPLRYPARAKSRSLQTRGRGSRSWHSSDGVHVAAAGDALGRRPARARRRNPARSPRGAT